jgi:transcriptional regulator with XRE-family HTH domain
MLDIAAQFGDNLVRSRKLADLSQDELSFLASVHRTEISQLERGLRIARIDTLAKLYGSLEVEPASRAAKSQSTLAAVSSFRPCAADASATRPRRKPRR